MGVPAADGGATKTRGKTDKRIARGPMIEPGYERTDNCGNGFIQWVLVAAPHRARLLSRMQREIGVTAGRHRSLPAGFLLCVLVGTEEKTSGEFSSRVCSG